MARTRSTSRAAKAAKENVTESPSVADGAQAPSPASKRKSIPDSEDEPFTKQEPSPKKQKLPVRGPNRPAVVKSHESFTLEIPVPVPVPSSASKRSRDDEVRDSEDPEDEAEEGEEASDKEQPEDFKTPLARRHITFDDDDNDQFVTPMEAPPKDSIDGATFKPAEDDDGDDDDDDSDDNAPPEAVSSHVAQAQMSKAKEAAKQATKEQDAALKRRRQDRETVLRKQAKKRKSEKEAAAESPAAVATEAEVRDQVNAQIEAEERTASRKRKLEVPDLLPLEFLESDDEDDEPTPVRAQAVMPKKIKFEDLDKKLALDARPPRDERVGSTVYRVVSDGGDKKMAPRMNKHTRNLKEGLMARKKVAQKKGGFLVKSRS